MNRIAFYLHSVVAFGLAALCRSDGAPNSEPLEELYKNWMTELEVEIPKRGIGMVFTKGDPLGNLPSFLKMVDASIDEKTWARFVSFKIDNEATNTAAFATGAHVYLAYAACARFNWDPKTLLASAVDYNVNEWPANNTLLKTLVSRKLKLMAVTK